MVTSLRGLSSSEGLAYTILTAIFTAITIVVTGLRLWACRLAKRRLERHDQAILLSLVRKSPAAYMNSSLKLDTRFVP
jgi:hypothetical protein